MELPPYQCIVTSPPYWQQRTYGGEGELGRESEPETYVETLATTLLQLSEKMPKRGTLWLNLGDKRYKGRMLGLPWKVAHRLQDLGLYLKNEIIWHKRRIMPESTKSRVTHAHEQLFFFTRRRSGYTFNQLTEPALWANDRRKGKGRVSYGGKASVRIVEERNCRSVWDIVPSMGDGDHDAAFPVALAERCVLAGSGVGDAVLDPFAGTCTTGIAALRNGRRFVGVDVVARYLKTGKRRLNGEPSCGTQLSRIEP